MPMIRTLPFTALLLAASVTAISIPAPATAGVTVHTPEASKDPSFIPEEFETFTLVLLRKGDAWTAESTPETEAIQGDHLAYLGEMWKTGRLVVAGPFDEQDDDSFRGLCLYRASLDEARRLAEADPAVQAGRLRVEAMTWWVGKGQLAFPGLPTQEVTGTARNAKGGAVVVQDDGRVVYVQALDSWPDDLDGQAVIATGHLVQKAYLPVAKVDEDGAISQGTSGGEQWVLEDATWVWGVRGGTR